MNYLYDGGLSEQRVDWLKGMLKNYPYAVEVDGSGVDYERMKAAMPEHTYWKEGDMGGGYDSTSMLYSCVSRDDSDDNQVMFYCFLSDTERQIFCTEFADHIIDANPFKTRFAA